MNERKIVYFASPGENNTEATLNLVRQRLEQGDISRVLVATTSGATGLAALNTLNNVEVIAVSHSHGFKKANQQELTAENREAIEGRGGRILTCMHAFGGVGRAIRKKWGTFQLEEFIAHSLRIFGEGTKVGIEMVMMAADAGLINAGENVLTIAGTDHGADTALIIKAANAQNFFDLRVQEIICKPLY